MITSRPGYFVNRRPSTVTASPYSMSDNDFLTASSKSSARMVLLSRIFPFLPMITRSQGYSPCDNEVLPLPLRGRDDDNDDQLVVLIPRILLDMLAPMLGGGVHVYYIKLVKGLHVRCDNEHFIMHAGEHASAIYSQYFGASHAAIQQRYLTALLCRPTKQPYKTALSAGLSTALPCLALQGALSWLPGPRDSHSAREFFINFEYLQ